MGKVKWLLPFNYAGFDSFDVHMSELSDGDKKFK